MLDAPPVIVLGSINLDLTVRGPRLPAAGETVLGGSFYQAAGGKGANQAVAAARAAETPVTFVAAVGDDLFGQQMRAQLQAERLDCALLKTVAGQPTGVALILVDAAGQNCISVAGGANLHLTPADIDALPDSVFRAARVFLASCEIPLDTVRHALHRAKQAGLTTILNPAPAHLDVLQRDLLRDVDVLTPNLAEAALLTGWPQTQCQADPAAAAQQLIDLGCRAVVMTLESAGCLVQEAKRAAMRIAGHPVQAVDTTAAGDAFNGALAVALAELGDLERAAAWANAAGALSVTRRGAQPSLPTRREIDELFAACQDR